MTSSDVTSNKETVKKKNNEEATYGWEKIFENHMSDKKLMTKIYQELRQLNRKTKQNKQMNNTIEKWANDLNRPEESPWIP